METYDKTSADSILDFAKRLTGKSLSDVVELPIDVANGKNKGDLGTLLQDYYFKHRPATNTGPDFEEAGVELKATGVVPAAGNRYKAKERLVLTMINYEELVEETWERSKLLKKCQLMLLMFYLYEKHVEVVNRRFILDPILYKMIEWDIETIRRDWEYIRQKVKEGKAHELSEGDTVFLRAARKGSGGPNEPLRKQPYSSIGAKARAFAFKTTYVDSVISGTNGVDVLGISASVTFEQAIQRKFDRHIGRCVEDIGSEFGLHKVRKSNKGFHRQLAVKMLASGGNSIPELDRAGIELKTIRLTVNGKARESMSFPGFKFLDIVTENWDESPFREKLEKKFLFVVFQSSRDGRERFVGAVLWNMPYLDRLEAQRVWEETRRRVLIDATDLPKISESPVAHVRPKGRDGNDKIPTPQGGLHLRQAFWLNSTYIGSILKSAGDDLFCARSLQEN